MPADWTIGAIVLKGSFIASVVSLVLGLVFFRLFTPFPDKFETKAREDDLFTLTLSLIITIWMGKIIVRFFTFIQNPQAVLNYPADKYALYLAIIMTVIYAVWHFSRKEEKRPISDVLLAGLMVLLMGQFLYDFISFASGVSEDKIVFLVFHAVLLALIVFLKGRVKRSTISFGVLTVWALGHLVLSYFWTGPLFQFYVGPIFWFILMIAGLIGLFYVRKHEM